MARLVRTNLIEVNQKIAAQEDFVLFAYTNHCAPCEAMKTQIEKKESTTPVYTIDISEYPELVSGKRVIAVPTAIHFGEEGEIQRIVGCQASWKLSEIL